MNVIATYNPGFILAQNARLSGLFEFALKRVVDSAKGIKFPWDESEFILRPSADEVERVLASMAGRIVCYDVETDGRHPLENQLRVIGFHDGKVGIVVPLLYRPGGTEDVPEKNKKGEMELVTKAIWKPFYTGKAEQKVLKAVSGVFKDAALLIAQNGQYDRMVLRAQLGIVVEPLKTFDTLVAHHVLAPFLPHDLGLLASLYTNAPFYKATESGGWAADTDHNLALYNLRDVKATWLVGEAMQKELKTEYAQAQAVYTQDIWQEQQCEDWKRNGIAVDGTTLRFFRYSYMTKRDRALTAMRKLLASVGIDSEDENFKALLQKLEDKADSFELDDKGGVVELFNPGSLLQLRQMLKGLKIPLEEVTASGQLSTAKEILTGARKELLTKGVDANDPRIAFLDYLFAWREAAKVVGTYLYPEVLSDGRVHPTFSVHVVPTGRLSSSGPNFQNQPPEVRGMFVARPGHTIVSMDWDALEMRLGAFLSGDKRYIEVFKSYDAKTGPKPHHANMAAIFGLEPTKKAAEQNPGMYRAAKVFAYAVAYGAGEDTVFEQVREELPDMKWESFLEAFSRYKKTYPQLFAFQQEVVRKGTRQGYLDSGLLGRRVYFFEKAWGGTSPEATAMQNMPYQSTGSDIVGQANKRVMDRLVGPWQARLQPGEVIIQLAQVHDELVFEVPLRLADEFCAECKRISEEPPRKHDGTVMDWSLPVDIHHDRRWKPVQARCQCRELVDIDFVKVVKRRNGAFDLWEGECDACKAVKSIEVPSDFS